MKVGVPPQVAEEFPEMDRFFDERKGLAGISRPHKVMDWVGKENESASVPQNHNKRRELTHPHKTTMLTIIMKELNTIMHE
jgi:hypothetical protein